MCFPIHVVLGLVENLKKQVCLPRYVKEGSIWTPNTQTTYIVYLFRRIFYNHQYWNASVNFLNYGKTDIT